MGEKIYKGCVVCSTLIILFILVVLAGPAIDMQIGLFKISQRLDIESTLPALTEYFEETFVPGVPRDDIDALLQSSGAARVRVNEGRFGNCELVVYFIGYWPLNRLSFHLCYDKKYAMIKSNILNHIGYFMKIIRQPRIYSERIPYSSRHFR